MINSDLQIRHASCGIRFQCISISCVNAHASIYTLTIFGTLDFDIFRIHTRIRRRMNSYLKSESKGTHTLSIINGPRQANLVLITYASIRAVSPEPPLLAHTSNESRGTFRQKARSLAPLNGWACAIKIFHDGMLEDTNSLDAAQMQCTQMLRVTTFITIANM